MEYLIYLVTNKINCKRYIGQTKQGRLDKRIFEHLIESKATGTTVIFHNAIRKYGIENFEIEVIEDHIPEEEIDEKEKFYIQFYNTYYKEGKGYNMTLGGQGTHGYIFTEEDKAKMREKNKAAWKKIKLEQPEKFKHHCEKLRLINLNKKVSLETRKKLSEIRKSIPPWNKGKKMSAEYSEKVKQVQRKLAKSIVCFSLDTGKFIKSFEAIPEATEFFNLPECAKTRIYIICRDNKGHAYGYIWRYLDKYKDIYELPPSELSHEHHIPRSKIILQYDLNNNLITEFESAAAYARTVERDKKKQRHIAQRINVACRSNYKIYRGFIWKYKEN